MKKSKGRRKKIKIKYKSIILLLFLGLIISLPIIYVCNLKIKNIYIKGNSFLTDQQIIDIAKLSDYPKVIEVKTSDLKRNLNSSDYIENVKIKYSNFRQEVDIYVEENIPVVFYQYDNTYLLSNGASVTKEYDVPILINQTPDKILKKLLNKLSNLDKDIINRISEIRYYPSDVDEELFFLTMEDGNYVYINFNSFDKLENYIEFIKSFDNKKGIIHLDSGDYLELFK